MKQHEQMSLAVFSAAFAAFDVVMVVLDWSKNPWLSLTSAGVLSIVSLVLVRADHLPKTIHLNDLIKDIRDDFNTNETAVEIDRHPGFSGPITGNDIIMSTSGVVEGLNMTDEQIVCLVGEIVARGDEMSYMDRVEDELNRDILVSMIIQSLIGYFEHTDAIMAAESRRRVKMMP